MTHVDKAMAITEMLTDASDAMADTPSPTDVLGTMATGMHQLADLIGAMTREQFAEYIDKA